MIKLLLIATLLGLSATSLTTYQLGLVTVTSNDPSYGPDQVQQDLQNAINHEQDQGNIGNDMNESVAAIMSAAGLLYPELPTKSICRVIIGDIKTETDFTPSEVSPGRDGSGSSWGLMQVSPGGDSQELSFFQSHFSDASLLDWDTGAPLDIQALSNNDLLRPWVNVHVASWFQSNLGRSGSSDPSNWGSDDFDGGQSATVLTSLGSWVARPADDSDGYNTSGDDISGQYFQSILEVVSYLEDTEASDSFLSNLELQPQLVAYQS